MLKKLINYTDYNGNERSENFYFNLSESELMDMELSTVGGFREMIQLMIDKQDTQKIIEAFKMIIMKAYGEKSADGRRFIKSKELSEAFTQTDAYNKLYMELISDANAAADFMSHIVPASIQVKTEEAEKDEPKDTTVRLLDNKSET